MAVAENETKPLAQVRSQLRSFLTSPSDLPTGTSGISIISGLFLLPSALKLNVLLFGFYVLLFGAAIFWSLRQHLAIRRKLFFEIYLDDQSTIWRFSRPSVVTLCLTAMTAFFWAMVTVAILFAYGAVAVSVLGCAAALGSFAGRQIVQTWIAHARPHFRPILSHRWSLAGATCLAVVALVFFEFKRSASISATELNVELRSIEHPIYPIQVLARASEYLNSRLHLAYREVKEKNSIIALLFYLVFACPNALAIGGAVLAMHGVSEKTKSFFNEQKQLAA